MAIKKIFKTVAYGATGNVVGITHILWTPKLGKDVRVHYGIFVDSDAYANDLEPLEQHMVVVPNCVNKNIRKAAYEYLLTLPEFSGSDALDYTGDEVVISESVTNDIVPG